MGKNKGIFTAFFVFFLAVFGIVFTNYHPGTLLTGWDNLHSEFNFLDNIRRSIFSAWQDYEGVGTFVGVSDAADLPRILLLWYISWLFSPETLRYAFHFLMLFVGTIGTYVVIRTFFVPGGERYKNIAAIFGGLFYLLNLGTIQYFAVPFEPFSSYWAMFPWLMFVTFRYLKYPTHGNLLFFALLHFLATPSFFLQTIFYVYVLILLFVFTVHFVTNRSKTTVKTLLTAFLVFLSVNAFWFLPHVYWFVTERGVQQAASMNTLTTDETFQRVQQFGNLSDFMLFRNKPWDYRDFTIDNQQFVLQPWHEHFSNIFVQIIGYTVFIIALVGLITNKINRGFSLGLAVICFIILANQAPVAEQINALFRKIPLVNQALRDPFTKFIVPTLFVFSVGFSGGIMLLYKRIPVRLARPLSVTGVIVLGAALFVYALPAYSGHFFADRMRVATPKDYFNFFAYMQGQDQSQRIANLPQGPIWGWTSYQWGYTGSGFLWHGFSQSIPDRTFDVWNDKNEEYYWELVYALNKRDYELFHSVLKKYDISYVMFDSDVYFPDNPNSAFTILRQKEFIENDSALQKITTFGSIDLYKTDKLSKDYISVITNPVFVDTQTNWLGEDRVYREYGDYIVDNSNPTIFYPFRSLFSGRGSSDSSYTVSATPSAFTIRQEVPAGTLVFPAIVEEEFIRFDATDLRQTKQIPFVVHNERTVASDSAITEGALGIIIEKDNRYGSYTSSLQTGDSLGIETVCNAGGQNNEREWSQALENDEKSKEQYVRFHSLNARTCRVLSLLDLSHRSGYLVAVKSRNKEGNTLRFWIENITEKRSEPQIFLKKQATFGWEYFVIPPMAEDGVGYALHFDNVSIGKQESVNDLAEVIVYPIPYRFLTGLKIVQKDTAASSVNNVVIDSVDHPLPYLYHISLQNVSDPSVIALYQSYNQGWNAYVVNGWLARTVPIVFGKELKGHVMVNNWANGWDLSEIKDQKSKTKNDKVEVVIIFWPQLLQYFGFALLPLPFVYCLWPRKKQRAE